MSPTPAAPAISIAIVSFGDGATLAGALGALPAQTFTDFEVLVVDNGTELEPLHDALAACPGARLISPGANLGFAAGVNLAAREATGRWLVSLNPDAYAEPDWLEQLMAAAARYPETPCFTSLQVTADDPNVLDGAGDVMTTAGIPYRGAYHQPRPAKIEDGEVFSPCGAAMMIERELFLAMGGLDERYFCYCEDVDLGYRLRLAGRRTLLAANAVVRHVGSATSGGAASDFALYHGLRNRLWVFVKNSPPLLFWLGLPLHAAFTALQTAMFARRRMDAPVRGIRDALRGMGPVWRARRETQEGRRVGSLSVMRAMAIDPFAFLRRAAVIRTP